MTSTNYRSTVVVLPLVALCLILIGPAVDAASREDNNLGVNDTPDSCNIFYPDTFFGTCFKSNVPDDRPGALNFDSLNECCNAPGFDDVQKCIDKMIAIPQCEEASSKYWPYFDGFTCSSCPEIPDYVKEYAEYTTGSLSACCGNFYLQYNLLYSCMKNHITVSQCDALFGADANDKATKKTAKKAKKGGKKNSKKNGKKDKKTTDVGSGNQYCFYINDCERECEPRQGSPTDTACFDSKGACDGFRLAVCYK